MKIEEINDRLTWDNFVTSRKEANFLQSWDFYEFHANRGKKIVRRALIDNEGKIMGAYAGGVETAKRGKHLAIAGGPIIDWQDNKAVKMIFQDIKKTGTECDCTFVRVRPQLPLSEKSLKLMSRLGLKKAPMYLSVEYAGILDLTNRRPKYSLVPLKGFVANSARRRKTT